MLNNCKLTGWWSFQSRNTKGCFSISESLELLTLLRDYMMLLKHLELCKIIHFVNKKLCLCMLVVAAGADGHRGGKWTRCSLPGCWCHLLHRNRPAPERRSRAQLRLQKSDSLKTTITKALMFTSSESIHLFLSRLKVPIRTLDELVVYIFYDDSMIIFSL